MRALHLVSLALLAIGSFAVDVPRYKKLQSNEENDNFWFGGKKWALLVAGSSGWYNYRHQADICHAYHIMRENGIPEENIITMMVDDIAYNEWNPTPGKIINSPGGKNVYKGVVIDYKGTDVTSTNFLNILTGNKTAMKSIGSGKVIEAGRFDRIFINFVDHGSTGILGFPDDYLYADQLNEALYNMQVATASYKKILLYIEACEAGSMFDGILSDSTSVFAVTASGPRESSYACYYDYETYGTYLGDSFSVTWMEDLDNRPYEHSVQKKRPVFNHVSVVRTNVIDSNVMMYGDFEIGQEKLSAFIGYRKDKQESTAKRNMSKTIEQKIAVSSRDVHRYSIENQLENTMLTGAQKHKLAMEISLNKKMRNVIDSVFRKIYSNVVLARPVIKNEIGEMDQPRHLSLTLDMFPCYRSILNKITKSCFSLPNNPYSLDRLTIFANMCVVDKNIHQEVEKFVDESCSNIPQNIVNVY